MTVLGLKNPFTHSSLLFCVWTVSGVPWGPNLSCMTGCVPRRTRKRHPEGVIVETAKSLNSGMFQVHCTLLRMSVKFLCLVLCPRGKTVFTYSNSNHAPVNSCISSVNLNKPVDVKPFIDGAIYYYAVDN